MNSITHIFYAYLSLLGVDIYGRFVRFFSFIITYQGGTMPKNTQNSILRLHLDAELQRYNLEGKWNDYIAVQKEVLRVLKDEKFFDDNIVVHKDSGMVIKVTPKGIKETFGNGKHFSHTSKCTKQFKVATISHIKGIISSATLISNDVISYHPNDTSTYAYMENQFLIDNIPLLIRITIKRK